MGSMQYLPFLFLLGCYAYSVLMGGIYKSDVWCALFVLLLILFSGYRYGVGTDYWTYVEFISAIRAGSETYMEAGFEFLVYILNSTRLVFLFSATLTIITFFVYFKKFSPNLMFSAGLFLLLPIFYLASFNGVRQFVAVGLFVYALQFVVERKGLKYFCVVALAVLFHKSAVVLFPLYFVLTKRLGFAAVAACLAGFLVLVEYLPLVSSLIGFSDKYFRDEYVSEDVNYKSLVVVPVYLFAMMMYRKISYPVEVKNTLINMLAVSSMLVVAPILVPINGGALLRLSTYFTPALLALVPILIHAIPSKSLRLSSTLLVLLVSVFYYFSVVIGSGELYKLLPYCFSLRDSGDVTCFD